MKDSLFKKFLSGFVAVFMIFTCNMPMLAYAVDNDGLQVATSEQLTAADPNAPPATSDEGKEGAGALTAQAVDALSGGETLSENGTYQLAENAAGTITIGEGTTATIEGSSYADGKYQNAKYKELFFVVNEGATLTLKNVYVDNGANSKPVVDFVGSGAFNVEGTNILDAIGNGGSTYGVVHVGGGKTNTVTFGGSGVLYAYKDSGAAAIGSTRGNDPCGNIVFNSGTWNLKGTRTGPVIGNDMASSNMGTITVNGGELHVKGVSRGACIGGSASGNSTDVVINGGLVECYVDFSGASIGAGGPKGGSPGGASAGTLVVNGGSLKTVISPNAAGADSIYTTGNTDKSVVSNQSLSAAQDPLLDVLAFDTSKYAGNGDITVMVDGQKFYEGPAAYSYVVNEIKNPEGLDGLTSDNFLPNTADSAFSADVVWAGAYPNENGSSFAPDTNLYFYLSKAPHVITVGSDEYEYGYDEEAGAFVTATPNIVRILSSSNGSIAADASQAVAGATVTVTPTPADGYDTASVTVETLSGKSVEVTEGDGVYTFVMPNEAALVSAEFVKMNAISVVSGLQNGEVTVSTAAAKPGKSITVTATPSEGYVVDQVTYKAGTEDAAAIEAVEGVYAFEMPNQDVEVSATFKPTPHAVNIAQDVENGTVTVDPSEAGNGETVAITATPSKGYEVDKVYVKAASASEATEVTPVEGAYSFTMPAEEVTVSATFKLVTYNVTVQLVDGADVTTEAAQAKMGDTVTVQAALTSAGAESYRMTGVVWSTDDEMGKATESETAGTYTFTMPAGDVTISAKLVDKNVWTGEADISWYVGHENDTSYTLATAEQLAGLAQLVNGTAKNGEESISAVDFAGKTVSLSNDIKLAESDDMYQAIQNVTYGASSYPMTTTQYVVNENAPIWVPIAAGSASANTGATPEGAAFAGTFDGAGYTVSGVYTGTTDATAGNTATVQGLFGIVSGTVKNVTVTGCVTGKIVVGGIVAHLAGGTVQDCVNNAVVFGDGGTTPGANKEDGVKKGGAIGGIVGNAMDGSTVTGNTNNAVVTCANTSKGGRAGGIIGLIDGDYAVTIANNGNTGYISAYQYGAGIVGGIWGSAAPIYNCYNVGNVTGYSSGSTYVGGITGYAKSDIVNCYNGGKIDIINSGKAAHLGGIVSDFAGSKIYNCYNYGSAVGGSSYGAICGTGYGSSSDNKLVNCYTIDSAAGEDVNNGCVTVLSADDLKAAASTIGFAFRTNSDENNGGYPLLFWQANEAQADIATADSAAETVYAYTGEAITVEAPLSIGSDENKKALVEGADYAVTYTDNTEVGEASAIFTGLGAFTGTKTVTFDIKRDLSSATVEAAKSAFYTGEAITPEVVVKDGETVLQAGTDYTVAYADNTNVGMAKITVTGTGSYFNAQELEFAISYDFSKAEVGAIADQKFTGSGIEPELKVTYDGSELVAGTDYVATFAQNVNPGTASVTVTGAGNYSGTKEATFTVTAASLEDDFDIADIPNQPYKGSAVVPQVTITPKGGSEPLKQGEDFSVVCSNNVKVGTASVTIVASESLGSAVVDKTFEITQENIANCTVSEVSSQVFTGSAIEPKVTVTSPQGNVLVQDEDYIVAYLRNAEIGTASVKVVGRGNYIGLTGVDFTILDPSAPWNGSLDFSWYDEANPQTEYHIATPAQWASIAWICSEHLDELAAANEAGLGEGTFTNGNITAISGTIPTQQNYFTGVQFYLDNDIDMGGVKAADGTWSGPNYYPIGTESQNDLGQANGFISVFFGNFDGQGHYVNNINCQRGTSMDDQCVGLFGRVGQPDNDRDGPWRGKAYDLPSLTIQNVGVTGFIQGGRSVGGIVGKTLHVASGNSVTIQNCVNRADVRGSQAKGTGGICGAFWNKPLMYNCYSVGTAQNGYPLGSIVGGNEGKMYNIYTTQARTITGEQAGGDVPYNSYIVTDTAMSGNYRGTVMATEEAKQAAFADTLGWAYVADTTGINGGYPVLFWEAGLTEADVKTAFDSAVVTVESDQSVTFTGSAVEPQISVTIDGNELTEGTDYTVNCVDNVNVGTATVTSVEGAGAYSGTVPVDVAFQIVPRDMSGATITAIATQWTDGAIAAEPAMTVRLTGPTATLVKDTDYEVAFEGNLEEGTATATLTGIGNYVGEATATFEVRLMDSSLEGAGTEADPYIISNQGELEYVAQMVNAGDAAWQAADYKIGADFTATDIDGLGKNNSALAFKGTIDGDGKTITLDKTVSASYTGFVAYATGTIDDPVVIKNLTLAGSVSNTASYTAAFVGNASGYVEFADCVNKATVGPANSSYNAGFVAYNNATLTFARCVNAGEVSGQQYNAGFVAQGGGGTFTNCANTADITSTGNYSAGFVAQQNKATQYSACYNTGAIVGQQRVGGFTGNLASAAGAYVNVYNNGSVSGTNYVGGIIGYKQNQTFSITNAYNAQPVTSSSNAGGLVGYAAGNNTTSTFENAYWLAENPSVAYTVANANVIVTGEPQAKTADEFKALASTLGEAFAEDGEGVNGGYPVLSWQGGLVSIDNAVVAPIADQVFTGSTIEPVVVATLDSKMLAAGVDYDVAYANNENVGTATVTITGKGGYTGTASGAFNITSPSIEACEVAEIASQPYTGKQITPVPVITYNGQELEYGVDYALVFKNNTNIGTATVNIVGGGNFSGYVERQFDIVESDLASGSIDAVADQAYTSEAIVPALKVRNSAGAELTLGQDYLVAAMNNTEVGTASVTVIGQGNYKGLNKTTFQIKPSVANPSSVTVAVSSAELTYNGAVQKPSVTAKAADGTELVQGTDYTVAYSNESSTAAGSYKVTVTGKGNYLGAVEMPYAIKAASLASATVAAAGQTYTGGALSPAPTVNLGGTALKAGTDYSVSYANNVNAGTATVTVTGKGNYAGAASSTFKIAPASLAGASVTAVNQTYTGGALTPAATVKLGSTALKSGADFTVSYAGNTNAGKATVSVTGKGNYTGTASGSFTIAKASQKVTTKNKTFSFKVAKVKKKAQVAKAAKVKKGNSAKTAITYKLVKANKSKAKFKVASNGKITVKKGTAKGTYKLTIKATAKATANYNAASKNFVVTVKVK